MKLTDIDLSSLAEVGKAISFLVHVEGQLVNGDTPLPSLPPAQEIVVNPAMCLPADLRAETMMTPFARQQVAPTADPEKLWGLGTKPTDAAIAADVEKFTAIAGMYPSAPLDTEKLRALGVDLSGQPMDAAIEKLQALGLGATMDAATVFGQSAAPLSPAPVSAAVAASPTAPAAPPASGALPALPALAPLPAPSAAALVASVVQPSPAGGVELDTDGLPWDRRIHAGTKRKNADGRWTAKKGINNLDLVPRVVAQLRAQMAAGGVTAPQPAPSAAMPTLPEQPALPANPTSTLAALQAAMTPTSAPTTFQDFMTALTVEVQAGRVPIEALGAACQPLGGVSALNSKPELIPVAWASLKAKYPGML